LNISLFDNLFQKGERMVLNRRRTFIKSSTATAAALALGGCTTASIGQSHSGVRSKRNYLLVHGAWLGGWCWKKVIPLLYAEGHNVHVITLTGLGDRAHLHNRGIDLDTHIQDVVAYLDMEDLNDVVLVGHSYAGMVITGVCERVSHRLRSIVYLDAFLPEDGKRLVDYQSSDRREATLKLGLETGIAAPLPIHLLGLEKEEDIEWVKARLSQQSFQTFAQPVRLTKNAHLKMPRTYVLCTGRSTGSFGQFAEKVRKDPGWNYIELKTGHNLMITAAYETSRILLEAP
jgi:pimeloyl-ACP methyl ester carboxylesterase